jgi:hypothetical protein
MQPLYYNSQLHQVTHFIHPCYLLNTDFIQAAQFNAAGADFQTSLRDVGWPGVATGQWWIFSGNGIVGPGSAVQVLVDAAFISDTSHTECGIGYLPSENNTRWTFFAGTRTQGFFLLLPLLLLLH